MKIQIPSFRQVAGLGLGIFFLYSLIVVGINIDRTISAHQTELAAFGISAITFLIKNRIGITIAVAVLFIAKAFGRAPGPSRS